VFLNCIFPRFRVGALETSFMLDRFSIVLQLSFLFLRRKNN